MDNSNVIFYILENITMNPVNISSVQNAFKSDIDLSDILGYEVGVFSVYNTSILVKHVGCGLLSISHDHSH